MLAQQCAKNLDAAAVKPSQVLSVVPAYTHSEKSNNKQHTYNTSMNTELC